MKHVVLSLVTFVVLGLAYSKAEETTVAEISFQQLIEKGQLKADKIVKLPDNSEALKIENAGPEPHHVTLFTIDQPKITSSFYKLSGEVRYEGVAGDGYLEMWNHFADGGAYFSRTMGELGPMGKLQGTSDWRPFLLPFNATGAKSSPNKLVINLHLPGKGIVYLRSVKLTQGSDSLAILQQSGAWWSDRGAGLLGGIAGAVIGCLGSLLEWCAKRGKSRAFVLTSCRAMIGVGAAATLVGLFAVFSRQPYSVWYVLLLLGVLCVLIFPFRLRRYQELYRQLELRRMSALDAA